MINIREIDHLVLRVINIDAMLHFYCEVLGCAVERSNEEIGLIQLRAGQSLIDLLPADGKPGCQAAGSAAARPRNLDHFCLRVEPFDEAEIRHHLAAFGIKAGAMQSRYGAEGEGPSIYLDDPEGNVVELKGPATARVSPVFIA